jgi:hypothetical protein
MVRDGSRQRTEHRVQSAPCVAGRVQSSALWVRRQVTDTANLSKPAVTASEVDRAAQVT